MGANQSKNGPSSGAISAKNNNNNNSSPPGCVLQKPTGSLSRPPFSYNLYSWWGSLDIYSKAPTVVLYGVGPCGKWMLREQLLALYGTHLLAEEERGERKPKPSKKHKSAKNQSHQNDDTCPPNDPNSNSPKPRQPYLIPPLSDMNGSHVRSMLEGLMEDIHTMLETNPEHSHEVSKIEPRYLHDLYARPCSADELDAFRKAQLKKMGGVCVDGDEWDGVIENGFTAVEPWYLHPDQVDALVFLWSDDTVQRIIKDDHSYRCVKELWGYLMQNNAAILRDYFYHFSRNELLMKWYRASGDQHPEQGIRMAIEMKNHEDDDDVDNDESTKGNNNNTDDNNNNDNNTDDNNNNNNNSDENNEAKNKTLPKYYPLTLNRAGGLGNFKRRFWKSTFTPLTDVLCYLVDLSSYNYHMFEDKNLLELEQGVFWFKELLTQWAGGLFRRSNGYETSDGLPILPPIVLVFNKIDLYREKIKTIPIDNDLHPTYQGAPCDYEAGLQWIRSRFIEVIHQVGDDCKRERSDPIMVLKFGEEVLSRHCTFQYSTHFISAKNDDDVKAFVKNAFQCNPPRDTMLEDYEW